MKKLLLTAVLTISMLASTAWSSVYIRYYNKDINDYKYSCLIGGVSKFVEFGSKRSSSVVIPGKGDEVIISTPCGNIKLKNNSKIVIQDGCIKLQYQTDERDQEE